MENCIEWLNGQDTVTLTLSQKKFINRVKQLATKKSDVQILAENIDGSILAHVPLKYIKISPPRQVSEEQKEAARERLLQMRS